MDSLDTTARAAVALVLTVALLGATALAWRRRGPASGLRWLGAALLPVAAWLTGTLALITAIAGDVSRYVSRLVLSPVVWAGVVVLGVSVVLIGIGTSLARRGIGVRRGARAAQQGEPERDRRKVAAPAPAPAAAKRSGGTPPQPTDDGLDDDVSAILRRRGIS